MLIPVIQTRVQKFRRALVGEMLDGWFNLVSLVVSDNLNGNKDKSLWRSRKNGEFSTQLYEHSTVLQISFAFMYL